MEINTFNGEDSKSFKDLIQDQQQLLERTAIIKRWAAYIQPSGTTIAMGVTPTTSYNYISTSIQMSMVNGKDILNTGGTLKFGDINILSRMPIFEANKVSGTEADKFLIDNETYELVGKVFRVPVAGGYWAFKCTGRKMSDGS